MASTRFMVEELRRERERSSLDLEELTQFLDGGAIITEKKRAMCKRPWAIIAQFYRMWLRAPTHFCS